MRCSDAGAPATAYRLSLPGPVQSDVGVEYRAHNLRRCAVPCAASRPLRAVCDARGARGTSERSGRSPDAGRTVPCGSGEHRSGHQQKVTPWPSRHTARSPRTPAHRPRWPPRPKQCSVKARLWPCSRISPVTCRRNTPVFPVAAVECRPAACGRRWRRRWLPAPHTKQRRNSENLKCPQTIQPPTS